MTPTDTILFIGPTLTAAEVAARLPDAEIRPPAAVGDVLAACARRPARIAIVDGYFERMAAVWHKELVFALARGVRVYGAASMGALRAAECAPFGMIGAGAIYRAYVRGAHRLDTPDAVPARGGTLPPLIADDEVAVAHLPAEHGYRAVSDALVNVRDGLALAVRAGAIRAATAGTLIGLARARFYRERSWIQLDADARAAGVSARQLAQLAAWRAHARPDRKAADARALLAHLRSPPSDRPGSRARPRMPRTWAFAQLEKIVARGTVLPS
jgi:hypothetical protein